MSVGGVDVLGAMRSFMLLGGSVIPGWNTPRSTGWIANRLRFRPREYDGRVVKHKTPSTATVLRAMQRAEREGLVERVEAVRGWRDQSAAEAKECWWKLTPAALAEAQEARRHG